MSHLDPERLAALADDIPTAAEAAHLAQCIACSREREAYRALLARAQAERELPGAPLTNWESLAAQLGAEGLMVPASGERASAPSGAPGIDIGAPARPARIGWPRRERRGLPWWMQAAAAVLLVAGGVVAGRASVTGGQPGTIAAVDTPVRPGGDARFARQVDTSATFRSVVEAQVVLTRAENDLRRAMTYLAATDTASRMVSNADLYRARLAALDGMAASARQGVNEMPHDPLMSQYYISTLAAREVALRQLDTTLRKEGVRINRF